jgi:hypothetical protein
VPGQRASGGIPHGPHPGYRPGMDEDATPDDIARLEETIEAFRESLARCRKIALAARVAIGAGAIWLALTLVWLVPFITALVIGAIAAVIGGIVLAGSNSSTRQHIEARLRASEALRNELIDRMELQTVR